MVAAPGCVEATAGGVKIIANTSVSATTVSVVELKSIFLQERTTLRDGTKIVPILQKQGASHEAFLNEYLHQDNEALQKYYRRLAFTGTGTVPKSFVSESEVIAYVSQTRGALGYVSTETDTRGVKTLTVMRVASGPERTLLTRVEPEYPRDLNVRRIGGMVRLKVTVSDNGSVEQIDIIGGNPVLAEAAAHAVEKWKYTPAPAASVLELNIPFDPQG
jgi:TonB family protein